MSMRDEQRAPRWERPTLIRVVRECPEGMTRAVKQQDKGKSFSGETATKVWDLGPEGACHAPENEGGQNGTAGRKQRSERLGLVSHGKEVNVVIPALGKGFAAGWGRAPGSDICYGLEGAGWKWRHQLGDRWDGPGEEWW